MWTSLRGHYSACRILGYVPKDKIGKSKAIFNTLDTYCQTTPKTLNPQLMFVSVVRIPITPGFS